MENASEQVNQEQEPSVPVRTRRKYKLTKKLVRPKIRPLFQSSELDHFFDLIEKYKNYVLNQSGTVRARKTKNLAWEMLAKEYNSQGFKYYRSTRALHHKWRVLTCLARKTVRNTEDLNTFSNDKQFNRLVGLVSESMSIKNEAPFLVIDNDSIPENLGSMQENTYFVTENTDFLPENTDYVPENADFLPENTDYELETSDGIPENTNLNQEEKAKPSVKSESNLNSNNSKDEKSKRARYKIHFSQEECRVLLQCIINVKEALTYKKTSLLNKVYNRKTAWQRVAKEFNSKCNRKLPVSLLRGKFSYLKGMAKYTTSKCLIGLEPYFPLLNTPGCSVFEAHVVIPKAELSNSEYPNSMIVNELNFDELCDYMKSSEGNKSASDYGIPIKIPATLSRDLEKNEVGRLKVELLKYQAENAQLEHERMLRFMEDQSLLNSLKLRAARLEAEAHALGLPPTHPEIDFDHGDNLSLDFDE